MSKKDNIKITGYSRIADMYNLNIDQPANKCNGFLKRASLLTLSLGNGQLILINRPNKSSLYHILIWYASK